MPLHVAEARWQGIWMFKYAAVLVLAHPPPEGHFTIRAPTIKIGYSPAGPVSPRVDRARHGGRQRLEENPAGPQSHQIPRRHWCCGIVISPISLPAVLWPGYHTARPSLLNDLGTLQGAAIPPPPLTPGTKPLRPTITALHLSLPRHACHPAQALDVLRGRT